MSDVVERVARTLCATWAEEPVDHPAVDRNWRDWGGMARAAIAAMPSTAPEVTPEMIDAGYDACMSALERGADVAAEFTAIYRAMHLARPLSEGPGA